MHDDRCIADMIYNSILKILCRQSKISLKHGRIILALSLWLTFDVLNAQCAEELSPFLHGVASGDATSQEVILWTRLTVNNPVASETVQWVISTDPEFLMVDQFGTSTTSIEKDYTVKVEVNQLTPDQWYYYYFELHGIRSDVGRTHTLPIQADRFTFAAFSCSNYESGYYNAYRNAALRNDLQAVFHLGDYYYEYSTGAGPGGRLHDPPHTAYTLDDYRRRHAQVASDPDAQWLRRQYPWYVIWDDHEFANDAWVNGSPDHDNNVSNWQQRKSAAKKAYYEWMPIRENPDTLIHRTYEIENLMRLVFVDSRMEGRMQQVSAASEEIDDTSRTILGHDQFNWLKQQLATATDDQWKVILNSVMMNKALNTSGIPLNSDNWEGYRSERDSLLRFIHSEQIDDVLSIAGDYHSSWAGDLPLADYNAANQTGSAGVEISVCATTSSPHTVADVAAFLEANPHIKWIEQTQNGYLLCTITTQSVISQWIYVNSINTENYTSNKGQTILLNKDIPFLSLTNEDLILPDNLSPIVLPAGPAYVPDQDEMQVLNLYPNPAHDLVTLSLSSRCGILDLSLFDVIGQRVKGIQYSFDDTGKKQVDFPLTGLSPGYFIIRIRQGSMERLIPLIIQ